jgi:hypothetical protein
MHTLQEFMQHTKGIAYFLGAAVLLAFIFFWLFLTDRQGKS